MYSLRAMHTYRLLGEHLGMASATIHRIEPAPVPAFPANVAVEAFRQTVRSAFEMSQIDFVAIVTGIFFLSVSRLQSEQQESDQDGEGLAHDDYHRFSFSLTSTVAEQHGVDDQTQQDQAEGKRQETEYPHAPLSGR